MKLKRMLSLILCVSMLITTACFGVYAQEAYSGSADSAPETAVEARIGENPYTTFEKALEAAQDGDTIDILADVEAEDVIMINKSVTINGNNHSITSAASRVIRITAGELKITLNDLNVVQKAEMEYPNDIRGISIDLDLEGIELTLNNCSVDFTDETAVDWSYGVNISGGTGYTLTVNGGSYEGANVINIWGSNHTVMVDGAKLTSIYKYSGKYMGVCLKINPNSSATVTAEATTFEGNHVLLEDNDGDEESTITVDESCTNNIKMIAAEVGGAYYYTIEEAISDWTNNKTLRLLSDVTLSDTVTLKSTEHHILNLGAYTMKAADGKDAIEITCEGQPKETYALTVNADETNPGSITATGNSCIYYRKSGTTKDRPIILINNGVFNGSYAINVYSSNRGTNCPTVNIKNGVFNGNVNVGNGKMLVSGGIFHGWINCTGDSTAYRQISGGTFRSWQFMTADAANKFWVGTSSANYNVGVYVDDNGYLVVGGDVITEAGDTFAASTTDYTTWKTFYSYLHYSSAKENRLYSTDAAFAFKTTKGTITLYKDADVDAKSSGALTIELADGVTYSGDVKLNSKTASLNIVSDGSAEFTGKVTQYNDSYYLVKTVNEETGVVTYTQTSKPAATGDEASLTSNGVNTMYPLLTDALEAATAGDKITLYKDVTYNIDTTDAIALLAETDEVITIDLNGNTISPADPSVPTFTNGKSYVITNGTIKGDVVNNGGNVEIIEATIIGNVVNNSGTTTVTSGRIEGDFTLVDGEADIAGGRINGEVKSDDEHTLDITGGVFTDDPALYVAEGYDVIRRGDLYIVTDTSKEAKSISVEFEKTDVGEDDIEGKDIYNIVLKANNGDSIYELASADLTFLFEAVPATKANMTYTITPKSGITLTNIPQTHRYMFNYDGVTEYEESGSSIVIATLTIEGYGSYKFSTVDSEYNVVNATTYFDNLVDYYVKDGEKDDSAATGGLVINTDTDDTDAYIGSIDAKIAVPTRKLTVNISFPNAVNDNAVLYQDMKVEITGNIDGVNKTVTYNLGTDEVAMNNNGYVVEEDRLVLNNSYTVTVSGAGYRTARYTVRMTDSKTVNFWNNVKDNDTVVEEGKYSEKKNFLAGDIVKDNQINIYDLSAVVSYFATTNDTTAYSDYAKYDLNRDGVIDAKDVAYVLVSWGE